jgi:hypothetical protein
MPVVRNAKTGIAPRQPGYPNSIGSLGALRPGRSPVVPEDPPTQGRQLDGPVGLIGGGGASQFPRVSNAVARSRRSQ